MWRAVQGAYLPNLVTAFRPGDGNPTVTKLIPYLENQMTVDGRATAYVCQNYACKLPLHDESALMKELGVE